MAAHSKYVASFPINLLTRIRLVPTLTPFQKKK
jgi:hypothetical protein